MKIDNIPTPNPASQIGEIAPRSPSAKPAISTDSGATSVNLSTASTQLRSLESNIASSSVVDKEKVAAIKQAISEGRFQVNSGAVADRLIESVIQLINADKSGSATV